jgi:hypothetical protein
VICRRSLTRFVLAVPVLVLATLALGGCGLAVGPAPSAGQLLVTSEFGAHLMHRSGS